MANTDKLVLCSGCLCADRKMTKIHEFCDDLTLTQIFSVNSELVENRRSTFCWECKAKMRKFILFRKQVNESSLKLLNIVKKGLTTHTVCKQPSLQIHQVHQSFYFNHIENVDNIVKEDPDESSTEAKPNISVKLEKSSEDYDEADADIEFNTNTKKRKKKKKKKAEKCLVAKNLLYRKIELTSDEIEREREVMRQLEDFVNAMFRCHKCIVTFPNKDDFNDHNTLKHDTKHKFRCNICECGFSSEMSFNYHSNRHTVRYECRACCLRFSTERSATKHIDNVHTHLPMLIPDLDSQVISQDVGEAVNEDKPSDKELKFSCEFCEKSFKWKASLRKHIETHRIEAGQKRKPYCEPCGLSFSTTSNLQKHVKMSSKHLLQLKLRKLGVSKGSEASEKDKIKQLQSSVSVAREMYACSQCDHKFQWRGNLARHLISHQHRSKRDLVCEPCNRTFSSLATYKQHMKISKKHVSEIDFQYMCSDCGSKFPNKTRLKDHINWEHLKNYVHKCEICEKVFKSHTSLYLHRQVVHVKNGTDHLCDHCGKSFANRTKLRSHTVAIHSGQSPYKCGQCSARFSWHSCLSRHVRKVH